MAYMKAWLLVGSFLLATMGCSSKTESYTLIDELPIPEGAYDTKKITLEASGAQQLFFKIREPYSSTRILDLYREFLRKRSWIQCSGVDKKWSAHEDQSSKPYFLVHEISEHWVKQDDRKLLILSAMYYSKELVAEQPDNDEQRLVVWVQRAANIEKELAEIGTRCDYKK